MSLAIFMKSPEQMSGSSEQPNKELERKITTPEEAAEMMRQRREFFGLGEKKEVTPEKAEEIEESIGKLLKVLDQYDFERLSPEIQEAMYWTEQEAGAGEDRELAEANLKRLIEVLQEEARKMAGLDS